MCYEAAQQDDTYMNSLLDSEDAILVEAVNGQYYWGSGIGIYATNHTIYEHLPGENIMGKIHMNVRK